MASYPPSGYPYSWCRASGEDEFGLWIEFAIKEIIQRMRWVKPGKFLMGSPQEEPHRYYYETQHAVTLTKGFWLSDTVCSQELWQSVMETAPSKYKGARQPVENINWDDCQQFFRRITTILPQITLSLPTETQWEYACRAATTTPFSFGITITPDQVNYNGKYPYIGDEKGLYREHPVDIRSLPPNQWGFYEMHGNVWEWCADWFGEYEPDAVIDPLGPSEGLYRVLRGGCAFSSAADCRSAARCRFHPSDRYCRHGFRFLWSPPQPNNQEKLHMSEQQPWPESAKDEVTLTTTSHKSEITA
ncbi:MAG: formylglycine-generating enzyme family protein [Chitinivibrionales bacterium]|nr:formylglycine-generating enzyme family protein [Chitinivibrionales bacterium]